MIWLLFCLNHSRLYVQLCHCISWMNHKVGSKTNNCCKRLSTLKRELKQPSLTLSNRSNKDGSKDGLGAADQQSWWRSTGPPFNWSIIGSDMHLVYFRICGNFSREAWGAGRSYSRMFIWASDGMGWQGVIPNITSTGKSHHLRRDRFIHGSTTASQTKISHLLIIIPRRQSKNIQRFDLYSKHNIYIDRYDSQQDDRNY